MSVTVAGHAGFCMGVKQAVAAAENAARQAASQHIPCYSLGEVVHNPAVTRHLAEMGVMAVSSVEDAQGGLLILRSHGVAPGVLRRCDELGIPYVDCTCPHVQALHQAVEGCQADAVVLIGEKEHPEVRGTAGWCPCPVWVICTPQEAEVLPLLESALVVSQTTLRRNCMEPVQKPLQ